MFGKRARTLIASLAAVAALTLGLSACSAPSVQSADESAPTLRLGYFDNVTHAPALVGLREGLFTASLGETALETQIFNAGPTAIEALSSGALDAAYIGPSPTINSYLASKGQSLVVVSGVTTGGAALVVREGIDTIDDLRGATLATPQIGNTQDVALRSWLADQGLKTNLDGTGDVIVSPSENADTLTRLKQGEIDGAWVPEPWASRLILEAGGHVLLNESELWPEGQFPTTVLVVSKAFYEKYGKTVDELVQANASSIQWITANPTEVGAAVNEILEADTGKTLKQEVLDAALANVTFTWNPVATAFPELLNNAVALGISKDGSLEGLMQLEFLNNYLASLGLAEVPGGGLR